MIVHTPTQVSYHQTLTHEHPAYPKSICTLPEDVIQPVELYTTGNTSLLSARSITIVGCYDSTRNGRETAYKLAQHFAQEGYTIIARGGISALDRAVVEGALSVVGGLVILALDSGLAVRFQHDPGLCARVIANNGLLISEYTQGRTSEIRQNTTRLVAMLCDVVVPVQATRDGNVMHLVQKALQYKRMLIVPQPVKQEADMPMYEGTRYMIQGIEEALVIVGKSDYARIDKALCDCLGTPEGMYPLVPDRALHA
jgi:predicted Rossmann fold nucleotide-binding protein DprA/Smf involved in DNA uptake